MIVPRSLDRTPQPASSRLTRALQESTGYLYRSTSLAKETTYTQARANLAALCDDVTGGREVVIIRRRGSRDVALVSADELDSLIETAHLLRSPKNAKRLLTALRRARGKKLKPEPIDKLRREFRLGAET
ncbi:MAG: type II toxin-antitoxin system Phd/YefM family antitoxin [Candidatus Binatia bacterium]